MSRRHSSQRRIDEDAFPVRVRLQRTDALGQDLQRFHDWLRGSLGRGEYAVHASGLRGIMGDVVSVHFRTVEAAQLLLDAFPHLVLADGTEAVTYTSPDLPFGRRSGR